MMSFRDLSIIKVTIPLLLLAGAQSCATAANVKQTKVNKVLILGNSITYHTPDATIGWSGKWGMAASAEQNDFVHLLTNKIKNVNKQANVLPANVYSSFETRFWDIDTIALKPYKTFGADVLILRLGDNITNDMASQHSISTGVTNLVSFLNKGNMKVYITGRFWPNPAVDNELAKAAGQNGWTFIKLSGINATAKNTAVKNFKNEGVGKHPSDQGMLQIANKIWASIRGIF